MAPLREALLALAPLAARPRAKPALTFNSSIRRMPAMEILSALAAQSKAPSVASSISTITPPQPMAPLPPTGAQPATHQAVRSTLAAPRPLGAPQSSITALRSSMLIAAGKHTFQAPAPQRLEVRPLLPTPAPIAATGGRSIFTAAAGGGSPRGEDFWEGAGGRH